MDPAGPNPGWDGTGSGRDGPNPGHPTSVSFLQEIVQFHLKFHLGVFRRFVVDILKFIPEFESLEKDSSRLSYDFSKFRVCISKFCR